MNFNVAVPMLLSFSRILRRLFDIHPDSGGCAYANHEFYKSSEFDDKFTDFDLEGKTVLEIGCGYGGYMAHAMLNKRAHFIHAYEPDADRVRIAKRYLDERNVTHYAIHLGDACAMTELRDSTIDVVVSDAVIEHIQKTRLLLTEIYRVLRPEGKVYISFSPTWYHYNGGHLWNYIPIPWVHLIFPDAIIAEVLSRQRETGEIPAYKIDEMIYCYTTLARVSLKEFRTCVAQSPFASNGVVHAHARRWKALLSKANPLIEELLPGNIRCVLTKTHEEVSVHVKRPE